jgi:hypothetical protein
MDRGDLDELHSIQPIANVAGILELGILSHNRARVVEHVDVAAAEIQDRRVGVTVPGGRPLHDDANLYFDARNPMMSVRRTRHAELKPAITQLVNNGLLDEGRRGRMFAKRVGRTYVDAAEARAGDLHEWDKEIERVTDLMMRMDTDDAEIAATDEQARLRVIDIGDLCCRRALGVITSTVTLPKRTASAAPSSGSSKPGRARSTRMTWPCSRPAASTTVSASNVARWASASRQMTATPPTRADAGS